MKTAAVMPAAAALGGGAAVATKASAQTTSNSTGGFGSGTGTSGTEPRPDHAGVAYSDMASYDDDGKPKAGFSDRSSKPKSDDPTAPYQMPLTDEEQAILDGDKGPELAKVMKIINAFGNAFNAEKLVDLGGAPHSSLFTGQEYLMPMINMFQECADAGLKAYAPYTVNPRC